MRGQRLRQSPPASPVAAAQSHATLPAPRPAHLPLSICCLPALPIYRYLLHRDLIMTLWYLSCGCWRLCTANAPSCSSGEAAAVPSGPGQGGWLPWLGPLSLVALGMGAQLCSLAARTQVTSAGS